MSQSDEVWVMCGGTSAANTLTVTDDVIAVNKDVFRYPNAKYFITIDNRFSVWEFSGKESNIPKTPTKIFVANIAPSYMKFDKSLCDTRFAMSYNLSYYDMVIKSRRVDGGFGTTFNDFRSGGNSGFCAVQLALLLGYKNIHIVGLDLCSRFGKTHHHEGYVNSRDNFDACFENYRRAFKEALQSYKHRFPNQTLINHSPISYLKEFLGYEPL